MSAVTTLYQHSSTLALSSDVTSKLIGVVEIDCCEPYFLEVPRRRFRSHLGMQEISTSGLASGAG
jgi:hypothetical protein